MAAKTRGRNKKEDPDYDPLAEEENLPKSPPKKKSGKKKVGVPSEKVPASQEVAQATSQGEDFAPAAATTISAELDAATTAALDEYLAKMKEINAKITEGARKIEEARKKKIKTAATKSQSKTLNSIREEEKADDTSVATSKISNTNKDKSPGRVSQSQLEEEVEEEGKVEVKDEELEEDPVLEQYSTFTLDERDSVNYYQMEDNEQPQ